MSTSDEITAQITKTEQELERTQRERAQIDARILYLQDECDGLEWLASEGDAKAAARIASIRAEIATRRLDGEKRAEQVGRIEGDLARLRVELNTSTIDEAQAQARRIELAMLEAYLELLDLERRMREVRAKRDERSREVNRLAASIRALGGNHPGVVFIDNVPGAPERIKERMAALTRAGA